MPVFDRTIVAGGRIWEAGVNVPDGVAVKITNPALVAQMGSKAKVKTPVAVPAGPALGDDGVQTVEQVVAWVGGDPGRAAEALAWESLTRGGNPRVSLLHALNDVIAEG